MERQDDILLKVRSNRSIVKAAFSLYTSKFLPMLKSQWVNLLDTTVVTAAVALLTVYGLYFFIPLAAVAVVLEAVLWLMVSRWLTQRPLGTLFRTARRHWLLLMGVVIAGLIALLPVCAVVALPVVILTLAEWASQDAQQLGDPQTMPSYVLYMAAVAWLVTCFLHICLRLFIVYIAYYAWGSAEAKTHRLS